VRAVTISDVALVIIAICAVIATLHYV